MHESIFSPDRTRSSFHAYASIESCSDSTLRNASCACTRVRQISRGNGYRGSRALQKEEKHRGTRLNRSRASSARIARSSPSSPAQLDSCYDTALLQNSVIILTHKSLTRNSPGRLRRVYRGIQSSNCGHNTIFRSNYDAKRQCYFHLSERFFNFYI